MRQILTIVPIALYVIVGIISLAMAFKGLFSNQFLSFHEKASGKLWQEIEAPLQAVIVLLLRISGLGFLIISVLLTVYPIVNYFIPNEFYRYSIPVVALLFCTGLFATNYSLYKKTKAPTPWKESLYAAVIVVLGIIISIIV